MNASTRGAANGEDSGRRIMFFEKHYTLYAEQLLDDCGRAPAPPIADLIRRYLLAVTAASRPFEADWCSFRELQGAGPLAGNFAANTHKTIAETFGSDLCALDCAAAQRRDCRNPARVSTGAIVSRRCLKCPSY